MDYSRFKNECHFSKVKMKRNMTVNYFLLLKNCFNDMNNFEYRIYPISEGT